MLISHSAETDVYYLPARRFRGRDSVRLRHTVLPAQLPWLAADGDLGRASKDLSTINMTLRISCRGDMQGRCELRDRPAPLGRTVTCMAVIKRNASGRGVGERCRDR